MPTNDTEDKVTKRAIQMDSNDPTFDILEKGKELININSLTETARFLIKKGYDSLLKEQEILKNINTQ